MISAMKKEKLAENKEEIRSREELEQVKMGM